MVEWLQRSWDEEWRLRPIRPMTEVWANEGCNSMCAVQPWTQRRPQAFAAFGAHSEEGRLGEPSTSTSKRFVRRNRVVSDWAALREPDHGCRGHYGGSPWVFANFKAPVSRLRTYHGRGRSPRSRRAVGVGDVAGGAHRLQRVVVSPPQRAQGEVDGERPAGRRVSVRVLACGLH